MALGIIGFSMSISTGFNDPKVAQNIGGLFSFIPMILFLALNTGLASNSNG